MLVIKGRQRSSGIGKCLLVDNLVPWRSQMYDNADSQGTRQTIGTTGNAQQHRHDVREQTKNGDYEKSATCSCQKLIRIPSSL